MRDVYLKGRRGRGKSLLLPEERVFKGVMSNVYF